MYFNAIPIKLPMVFFTELEQIISQSVWKYKKPRIAKAILRKKNGTGGINLLDFRLYYKTSHQDSMVLAQRQKYRSMEQNRKPRYKPTHLWSPYLRQRRQSIQWGKDNLFSKCCWENWSTTCKKMKLEHFPTPYTKNKLKMD